MQYDSALSILGIVLIPVLFWWLRLQYCGQKIRLLGTIIILFFGQGSLELAGLNTTISRFIFIIPLLSLFFIKIYKDGYQSFPGDRWFLFFALAAIPGLVNTSFIMYLMFILEYGCVIIAFYCFYNIDCDEEERNELNHLIIWLCVSQFFAAVIKYFMVGLMEPYIGSMASHSGGITTLFSLAGFSCSIIMYFISSSKKWLWMCIGFIVFGLVGEKRALVFMIPVSYFVCMVIYYKFIHVQTSQIIRKLSLGLLIVPIIFYVMVRVNPSFNPQREVWGEFDLDYTLEYAEKYNTGTLTGDKDKIGRTDAVLFFWKQMEDAPIYNLCFGYGTGLLVQSGFNSQIANSSGSIVEYSFKRWGIGYSMGIGLLKLLAQVGIIGTLCYLMVWITWFYKIIKGLRYYGMQINGDELGWCFSGLICIVVALILSFVYNNSSFSFNPASLMLVYVISQAFYIINKYNEISDCIIQEA